jgi:hypothetical protein
MWPIADIATCHQLRLHLRAYRALRVRECLLARIFVTRTVGGARARHGLPASVKPLRRRFAKCYLSGTN